MGHAYISMLLLLISFNISCSLTHTCVQDKKDPEWEFVDGAQVAREVDGELEKDYLFVRRPLDCTGLLPDLQKIVLGYLYNWQERKIKQFGQMEQIKKLSFSSSRPELLVILDSLESIRIYISNIGLARHVATFIYAVDREEPYTIAVSNTNQYVALGFENGLIDIIDTRSDKKPIKHTVRAVGKIQSLCFGHDGDLLGVCHQNSVMYGNQGALEFWDWKNNMCIKKFEHGPGILYAPRGSSEFLLLKLEHYGVRVYKVTNDSIEELFQKKGSLATVAENLQLLEFKHDLFKVQHGGKQMPTILKKSFMYQAVVNKDGSFLAINEGTRISVYDIYQDSCLGQLSCKDTSFATAEFPIEIQFSADGTLLCINFLNKKMVIWDWRKNILYAPEGHQNQLASAVAFSEDNKYMAVAINQSLDQNSFMQLFKNQAVALASSVVVERAGAATGHSTEFSHPVSDAETHLGKKQKQLPVAPLVPHNNYNFRFAIFGQPDLMHVHW